MKEWKNQTLPVKIVEEEQEKLDNMYENFSETEKYEKMDDVKDTLEGIKDELQEVFDNN